MIVIQYISGVNKKQGAKKRQLLNSPKNHINLSYMKSTSKVSKLSFTEINSNKSLKSLTGEVWKDVPDFEGCYKASNLGRVKTLDRMGTKEGIMKLGLDRYGYSKVMLNKEGVRYYFTAHRLIAISFIPNPENLPQVNHKNGIKIDNRIENLEWCSNKDNMKHAIKNGLMNNNGERNGRAKFTNEEVEEIRKRIKNKELQYVLAKEFNVSHNTIYKIKHGISY